MDNRLIFLLLAFILAAIIIIIVKSKKSVDTRQYWGSQIGLSAYLPLRDPSSYTRQEGWNILYIGDPEVAKKLLAKWYKFVAAVGPDVSGQVYALFPNLQTPESINYYGLTAKMIRDLEMISSKLDSPGSIKTLADVNRVFSADAIQAMSQDLNEKPQNGLYKDAQAYGNYIDVA